GDLVGQRRQPRAGWLVKVSVIAIQRDRSDDLVAGLEREPDDPVLRGRRLAGAGRGWQRRYAVWVIRQLNGPEAGHVCQALARDLDDVGGRARAVEGSGQAVEAGEHRVGVRDLALLPHQLGVEVDRLLEGGDE